jgi:hypothetical protein
MVDFIQRQADEGLSGYHDRLVIGFARGEQQHAHRDSQPA